MSFVQLHSHTEFSALDGLTTAEEAATRAASSGQPALAMTDHGMCSGHPAHQRACDDAGIKPVFGIETYFYPDRREKVRDNRHLVLLATDDRGLHDLWALSTEAWATGKYHNPRCDWETLERYGSRLIATTACLGGIVSQPLVKGQVDEALTRLGRLKSVFGDRLYLEIQGNQLRDQIRLNRMLAEIGEHMGIPLIAASDGHYPDPGKHQLHKLWMSCQTSPANDEYWNYLHHQTEAEVRAAFPYLDARIVDEAIRNTVLVSERCNARIRDHADPPVFLSSPEEDSRRLLDLCVENWHRIRAPGSRRPHMERLEREWRLVSDKKMAGCYLMVHDVVMWARAHKILIGPGRGSAAGSLMSYLLYITSMDPLVTGLRFERFLTPGRTALPDFDMDFPSSARSAIQGYVTEKYGEQRVVRVGTHMRLRSKGILNKLFAIMRPDAEDGPKIASIIDDAEAGTAGLGLHWPDLMDEVGDQLEPYMQRWPSVFEAAAQLVDRLNSYGQHPAGLVVSTDADLAATLPMRLGDKGQLISQWDFRDMEAIGLFKLDFLTLRTLDSVQEAIRLIEVRTGRAPSPLEWDAEHDDPQVWEDISAGYTTGMFQIETTLGVQFCRRIAPKSMAELAAINALVRPGPRNSGMAEQYVRRRAGREEVSFPHPRLETSLAGTYGLMIYQEDILEACYKLAGYSEAEADGVRKILGKKLQDKVEATGKVFVDRCEASGVDRKGAEALWEKMAEFGRYAFNLAHAYAYATLGYWTAWLKVHYPVEMLTAILSTLKDKDRMAVYAAEARRLGITILPPDVSSSGAGFDASGLTIRYGLASVKGLADAKIRRITSAQPYRDMDDFLVRSNSDVGVIYALARAGAMDMLISPKSRRYLVSTLEADRTGESTRCIHKDDLDPGPLKCGYDWENEPQEPRVSPRTGRLLKLKVLESPKKCWRACRQYKAPLMDLSHVPEFSPAQLWQMEEEIYGTWMTPALFEEMDAIRPGLRADARSMAQLLQIAPHGLYPLPAVLDGVRSRLTRRGLPMWWMRLATEVSSIDVAVFQPRGDNEPDLPSMIRGLNRGTLVMATVVKDSYVTRAGQPRTSWRLYDLKRLESNGRRNA